MKIILVCFGIKKGVLSKELILQFWKFKKLQFKNLKEELCRYSCIFSIHVYCTVSHLSMYSISPPPLPHLLSLPLNSPARLVTFTQLLYLRKIVAMATMSLKDTLHFIYLVFVNSHKALETTRMLSPSHVAFP